MPPQFGKVLLFTAIWCSSNVFAALIKFTYVECQSYSNNSKHIMTVQQCVLKAIRRDVVEVSIKFKFNKLPLHNFTGRLQLLKKENGFKPFLYNLPFNFCRLLNNARYPLSFEKFCFDTVVKYTNFNNIKCPWNKTYLSVNQFPLSQDTFRLPLPSGTYRIWFKLVPDGINGVQGAVNFIVVE